jgi:hypothetical protein
MHGLANMGWALAFMGLHAEARALGEASIAIADDLGMIHHALAGYTCLAHAAMASGDADTLREVNEAAWQRSSFWPQHRPGITSTLPWPTWLQAIVRQPASRPTGP